MVLLRFTFIINLFNYTDSLEGPAKQAELVSSVREYFHMYSAFKKYSDHFPFSHCVMLQPYAKIIQITFFTSSKQTQNFKFCPWWISYSGLS